MRRFRIPLLVTLLVSLILGIGLGWKLRRDRAAQLGVVTSSQKVRILALTGAIPQSVIRDFRSTENIEAELVEEATPDALIKRLEKDKSFDLVTLLISQTTRARETARIQPFNLNEMADFKNVSRDFLDLPIKVPSTVPILWGLLGFASAKEEPFTGWHDAFESGSKTTLKPYALEIKRLSKIHPKAAKASTSARFFADPSLSKAESDVVELSFSEATIPAYKDMHFTLPTEKAFIWILTIALTAEAKNLSEAKSFTNFLLKPENAVSISVSNHQASTNKSVESMGLLPTQKPSALRRVPLNKIEFIFDETKDQL